MDEIHWQMFEQFFDFLGRYRYIPPADVEMISRHLQTRHVVDGEVLMEKGQYARELYFITKGVLKIIVTNSKGDSVTQFFIPENRLCTILSSFNNNIPANEGIVAACDTEMIVLTQKNLAKIYVDVPYFKLLLDGIMQQALLAKIALRGGYLGEDATTRYHTFLREQPDIALRVSLNDIASYLEITPQSLSRIRRAIK